MRKLLLLLFALPLSVWWLPSNAQVDLLQGEWRDHLCYSRMLKVEEAGDWIFCSAQAGMLSYNPSTGDLRKHSKATGLSDVNISALAYAQTYGYLVVGYANGNIDLLREGEDVINLPDIKRKIMTADKTIQSICVYGNAAYLACGFGIVVLNLERKEIMETYYLGDNGGYLDVRDVAIFEGRIYAATEEGVYTASLNSPNLLDYSYWSVLEHLPQSHQSYRMAEVFNNALYLVYDDATSGADRVITANATTYQNWNKNYDTLLYGLHAYNGYLAVSSYRDVAYYNTNNQLVYRFDMVHQRDAILSRTGVPYVATYYSGFLQLDSQGRATYLTATGPRENEVTKVFTAEDRVWVSSGTIKKRYSNGSAYYFQDGVWNSLYGTDLFLRETHNTNTFKIAINPSNPNEAYVGSYLSGIAHWNGQSATHPVHLGLPEFESLTADEGVRVSGLEYDSKGNLWFVVSLLSQPLCRIDPQGNLKRFPISNSLFDKDNVTYTDLMVTSTDQIWISTENNGLVVLKENSEEDFEKVLFEVINQDNKLINQVYCLEEDREGNIWVGTNLGPVIYYATADIFSRDVITGIQPTYPRNDGTNNVDYLLYSEAIQDIECDGGNRKWLATSHSGAYLVSADGKQTLKNFHVDNSPLLSNTVTGVGVQEKTGEVFFATDKGLISYGGIATTGNENFEHAYVYPNPVRPNYEGVITVAGLMENTVVKITDISGNLVWETNSLGGQAIWDGRNFEGTRVASGIYLFMLATSDGAQSHIVKLLLMH